MSTAALLSFAEFEQLPDAPGKRELIDGELIELPPPKFSHSVIAKRIYELLVAGLDASRVFIETGYRIGDGWLQPDVSVIWPEHPEENDYLIGAPMIAVEILSSSNTAAEIERKLTLFFSEGSEEVWVVNPKNKTLAIYRRTPEGAVRILVDKTYTSAIGITFGPGKLW